jgi:hypothetical protein
MTRALKGEMPNRVPAQKSKKAQEGDARIMNCLSGHRIVVVRGLAWFGILAIVALSVVPSSLRPVTGWWVGATDADGGM